MSETRHAGFRIVALLVILAAASIPSLRAGTDPLEVAQLLALLLGLVSLAWTQRGKMSLPVVLTGALLASCHLALLRGDLRWFFTYTMGIYILAAGAWVGYQAVSDQRGTGAWLFWGALFGTSLVEIYLDSVGWSSSESWEPGLRGLLTSQSLFGIYLFSLSSGMVMSGTRRMVVLAGALGIIVAGVHVAVLGQGRSLTVTAAVVFVLCARTWRRRVVAGLLAACVGVGLQLAGWNPKEDVYFGPLMSRYETLRIADNDRINHVENGVQMLLDSSFQELLIGRDKGEVLLHNSGMAMHNGILDVTLNYGILAGTLLSGLWLALAWHVGAYFVAGRGTTGARWWMDGCAGIVAAFIASFGGAGVFWNWRQIVASSLALGCWWGAYSMAARRYENGETHGMKALRSPRVVGRSHE